jgi:hypothetical protein
MNNNPEYFSIRNTVIANTISQSYLNKYNKPGYVDIFLGLSCLLEEHFLVMKDPISDFFETADVKTKNFIK